MTSNSVQNLADTPTLLISVSYNDLGTLVEPAVGEFLASEGLDHPQPEGGFLDMRGDIARLVLGRP